MQWCWFFTWTLLNYWSFIVDWWGLQLNMIYYQTLWVPQQLKVIGKFNKVHPTSISLVTNNRRRRCQQSFLNLICIARTLGRWSFHPRRLGFQGLVHSHHGKRLVERLLLLESRWRKKVCKSCSNNGNTILHCMSWNYMRFLDQNVSRVLVEDTLKSIFKT